MERNYQLSRSGEMAQIEAIARHYAAHAQSALDLLAIVDLSKYGPLKGNATEIARHLADQLKTAHAHDLGIELKWPENAA